MATIAELLLARGRSEGDARRRQGESSAAMWSNLGGIAANALTSYAQQKEQEPIRKQEQQIRDLELGNAQADADARAAATEAERRFSGFLGEWDGKPDSLMKGSVAIFGSAGADKAEKIWKGFEAIKGDPQKQYKDTQLLLRDVLLGMDALPEDVRASVFPQVRGGLVERGVIKPEDAPEAYDPAWWKKTIGFGQEPAKPVAVDSVDAAGNPQTQFVVPEVGTTVPKPAPKLTIQEQANAALKAGDANEYARLMRVERDFAAAGRAPEKPEDPLARKERELRIQKLEQDLTKASEAPTANARLEAVAPVLDEIVNLSGKIFTSDAGPITNIVGAWKRAGGAANLNNDVREYRSLVRGFTPLMARAVGHNGVLTEQDVERTEMLFPEIGYFSTDNKTVANAKIDRMKTIMVGGGTDAEKAEIRKLMGWDKGAPTTGGRPKVGEVRTANGETRKWNGTEWLKQ